MKIIIITGQTSTGKTEYALKLAKKQNGEIINADSRQIYKQLDIITNKDLPNHDFNKVSTLNEFDIGYYQAGNDKVWLYDIVNPTQSFSAFDYTQCALEVIKKVIMQGKTPILVGGTYFYLYYLLYDVSVTNAAPDWELRKKLDAKSVEELQTMLTSLDDSSFSSMNESDRQNPRRLMRRIEIATSGQHTDGSPQGQTISLSDKLSLSNLEIEFMGLHFKEKDDLVNAIDKRVDDRIKRGAFEEVKSLLKTYSEKDPGLQTIGYKQIIPFIKGKVSKEEAIRTWITKELQYAKRQYTFMKKDKNITWKHV